MTEPAAPAAPPTALEAALDRVGDRWSLLVVDALLDGPRRFGELRDALPGIAPNILTDRLRRLERERILVSAPYSTRPPRMEYALTGDGRDLASALRLLADWGSRADRWRAAPPRPLRHGDRGALVLPDVRGRGRGRRDQRGRGDAARLRRGRRAGVRRPVRFPPAGRRSGSWFPRSVTPSTAG